jgi:hypothetical protein
VTGHKTPRWWTASELAADAAEAKAAFRRRRLDEPKDRYLEEFESLHRANSELIQLLPQLLADPVDPGLIARVLREVDLRMALRYLGAPPISSDDLQTLAECRLAWTRIKADPQRAGRIRDVLVRILDPKRFPWIEQGREPTEHEVAAANLASSVLGAAQRVQTGRRSDEKRELEDKVASVLAAANLQEMTRRRIGNIARDGLAPGQYARHCVVGEDEADIVVGLFDHRLLALECKASNSELNSRKRINKEIGQDAQNWLRRFGSDQIVPAAAIQGVFKPEYLAAAQALGVAIFWSHRLSDLAEFVIGTRGSTP